MPSKRELLEENDELRETLAGVRDQITAVLGDEEEEGEPDEGEEDEG